MKYRSLPDDLWTSPQLRCITADAKLVLVYLMTGPRWNPLGCYQLSASTIAGDVFSSVLDRADAPVEKIQRAKERVTAALEILVTEGIIALDSGWIWVKNQLRVTRPDTRKMKMHIAKLLSQVPECLSFFGDLEKIAAPFKKMAESALKALSGSNKRKNQRRSHGMATTDKKTASKTLQKTASHWNDTENQDRALFGLSFGYQMTVQTVLSPWDESENQRRSHVHARAHTQNHESLEKIRKKEDSQRISETPGGSLESFESPATASSSEIPSRESCVPDESSRHMCKSQSDLHGEGLLHLVGGSARDETKLAKSKPAKSKRRLRRECPLNAEQLADFETFWDCWAAYTKKNRKAAELAFLEVLELDNPPSMAEICDGVRRYMFFCGERKLDDSRIKHPQGWLRDQRWRDAYATDPEYRRRQLKTVDGDGGGNIQYLRPGDDRDDAADAVGTGPYGGHDLSLAGIKDPIVEHLRQQQREREAAKSSPSVLSQFLGLGS